jgi:hypothetical protein
MLSLGILSILTSCLGVSLDQLYEVSTHTFPWIRYPWNTLKWKLQRYLWACGFISCVTKISNKLSSVVAEEQLLYLPSYPVVLVSFVFLCFYLCPHYPWRSHPFTTSPPQLPHLTVNYVSTLWAWFRIDPSLERSMKTPTFIWKNSRNCVSVWFSEAWHGNP